MIGIMQRVVSFRFESDKGVDTDWVFKENAGDYTYVVYTNSKYVQGETGKYGVLRVYSKDKLIKEIELTDRFSIDLACKYISSINLDSLLERSIIVALLDVENIGTTRIKELYTND